MYEKLVKSLRICGRMINADDNCIAYYDGSCERWPVCAYDLMKQAADAIEERCQQVDKFMDEAARLYAKLPRWISVEETPKLKVGDKEYTGYLVYANGFYEIGDYTTDKFDNLEYFHVDGELETGVTHYMPLPEPPKEES